MTGAIGGGRGATTVRAVWLALLVAAAWFTAAAPASAHATLTGTTPADGATVEQAPPRVRFTFDEPVRAPVGSLRVFDREGERVDDAQVEQDAPQVLSVGLEPQLDEGAYVATWRAVSADGHPLRGAIVFSVGGGAVDEGLLARLLRGDSPIVVAVATAARAVVYGATLLAAGAVLWFTVIGRPSRRDARRGRTWAYRAGWTALVASLIAVVTEAMAQTGLGPVAALRPDVLGQTVASGFGAATALRVAALGALLVGVRGGDVRGPSRVDRGATRGGVAGAGPVGAGLVAAISFVVEGHTRTVEPGWLVAGADVVHLVAVAIWGGGVVLLALALRDPTASPGTTARVVARFSTAAAVTAVAATVAGTAMSWALVRSWRALFSTGYGWTLVVKLGLVAVVLLLAVVNNRVLAPAVIRSAAPAGGASDTASGTVRTPGRRGATARRLLCRSVTAEAAVMIAVVAVTAALVTQRPAAEAAGITGAFDTTVDLAGDLQVNVVVDPNEAGVNAIHLYVFDDTGRPVQDVDDLELRLTQPDRDIGPITRDPFVAGPGHWQLDGPELSTPGRWELEVVVPRGRFDEASVVVPVVVNAS